MRIIPAIDIINGQCVRLVQGKFEKQSTYAKTPLEMAKTFEGIGIKHLHLVDLDAARGRHTSNFKILEEIATKTLLEVDFGGGIRTSQDVEAAFNCGAKQITGGSIAVKNPELFKQWLNVYGSEAIILGADVFTAGKMTTIAITGWQEDSGLLLLPFLKSYIQSGLLYTVCTDIQKDGLLQGPSFKLYHDLLIELPELNLIASGGITTIEDLYKLKEMGCEGAIVGKALYEEKITLNELSKFIKRYGTC